MPDISIKDIESLNKLSGVLVAPFFSAAMFIEFGFWTRDSDKFSQWVMSFGQPIPILAVSIIAFIASVLIYTILYWAVDNLIQRISPVFHFFCGISALTFGVLGIGHGWAKIEPTTINAFWHLAAFSWGINIFRTENK